MESSSKVSCNMATADEEFEQLLEQKNDKKRARCNYGKDVNYACDSKENGTKKLKTHFNECAKNLKNKSKGKQPQLVFDNFGDGVQMNTWTFDAATAREYVVKMIIRDEMSFQSVEKQGLRDFVLSICPQFKMPSRHTIQRECWKLYISEREKVKTILKDSCQQVCLTTDTWTSSNMENYMCVTAHFVDNDWILQKKVINFCKIGSHRGNDIGMAIEKCLRYWGIEKKLLSVTVDNVSANDVACTYLSLMAKDNGCIAEGKYLHMRCVAHIVNLIVQYGIKQCGEHVDKLRAIVKYIRGSPLRINSFKMLAEKWKVECGKSLTLDVSTRWNSTYDMLTSALPYKTIFSRMDIPQDLNLDPLTDDDWSKIEVLASYLKEFYLLTNRISGSLFGTSNFMIFHIAHIVKVLESLSANENHTLKLMSSKMLKKCNNYWGSFEKINMLMLIATILDPFFKLRGVVSALRRIFPSENVDQMTIKVKRRAFELFDRYKAHYTIDESQDFGESSSPPSESSSWIHEFNVALGIFWNDNGGGDDRAEFDLYLQERNEGKELSSQDLLKWWRLNGLRYPIMARIARDVFAIPISTVPSEYAFSTGGRHLTSYKSRLRPEMVQALICTQDWMQSHARSKESDDSDLEDNNEVDGDGGLICT